MNLKPVLLSILLVVLVSFAKAQEAGVEPNVSGVQAGALGIWIHHESKMSSHVALRAEFGLDGGIFGGSFYDRTGIVLAPVLTVEPRWYYNLAKRSGKGKNTANNSANFLTAVLSYHPDWFTISNYENVVTTKQVSIIPTWGIKRTVGNHFTYELGAGLGYRYFFLKQDGFQENEGEVAVNLHIRAGYTL